MSIWDVAKGVLTSPYKIGYSIGKNIYDTATGRAAKDQQKLMNQQIKDYQEQSAITKEELAKAKDQQVAEKRRIQEKQIRALRGKSSSRGFLGSSNPAANQGMSQKLGG